ncbi:MAG: hypothetical protein KAT53_04240 [Dehalococcoidia bacterium]|nr:hypothetical protein [Dehalococcoidia bacterium]
MPYIVEKDYVKGTYLTQDAAIDARILYVANTTHLTAGVDMTIYDDTVDPLTGEAIDSGTGLRVNTETITPTSKTATTLVLPAPGLTRSYTAQLSGNIYQATAPLALSERVEFDIPILSRWCKIAQIKIVQQTMGAMAISFEVWEETPIYEGNRLEMHKNVIRRNILLDATEGGWYGESLVNNLILYKDREDPGEERAYNLHCALVNEAGGTVSDFHVLFKIADIGEVV